ncbi:Lpp/OprI family alanine-zipper lipoprotein [Colwellia piezophila]|uniref:Lpp/OprI family alanine-zipper lipoprotein n=1 Tax=Colwellia piezophila TaxID=211668 RepID=UPI00037BF8F5|nr:Lpp/OprI family alanine-zipper lipoprotein [Colwellia piezophila]
MLKKITAISLALTLTACANTDALDANISSLSNKVDALSAQVADLETQQQSAAADAKAVKAAAMQASADAKAANERIDNVVASYKK